MNILSLFDGISAGMVALERAGIKVDNYYASEIDKYAIKISEKNYPNIIHIGDVTKVRYENGILYTEKGEYEVQLDMLIGGSPCQGFSFSGKGLNFEDPRSKLFFEYVRIMREIQKKNPNLIFLLENVKMKKEHENVISKEMGVLPILINSSLLSAQSRKRLYWTNIQGIVQPEDKHIYLKDIIESGEVDREKSYCIDANYYKGGSLKNYLEKSRRQIVNLPLHQSEKRLMVSECIQTGIANINGHDYVKRTYSIDGKSPTLNANSGGNLEPKITTSEKTWRKLTPLECERLQTFSDFYTEGVSNTQRYKMLGNSWTVDVIAHIFSFIHLHK